MKKDLEAGKLGNVRLRYDDTGVIYLSRTPRDVVAYMDEHYVRLKDQMAWRPKCCFPEGRLPASLKPHFGRHVYIIGKGQSADKLGPEHFPTNDPIIGINEAFLFMERLDVPNKIFGIRQDAASGVYMAPTTATILINRKLLPIYAEYKDTYVFNPKRDFGIRHSCATVVVAMGFAKAMGCTTLTMYGFDAYTVGSVAYGKMANCRNQNCDNMPILKQRRQLKFLDRTGLTVRWVTPDLENYLTAV